MTARLQVKAEPFDGYSEIPGELQSERSGSRPSVGRSGGRGSALTRQSRAQRRPFNTMAPPPTGNGAGYGVPYSGFSRRPRRSAFWTRTADYGSEPSTDTAASVRWAQQCLRRLLGPSVPQSGGIGRAMRRAIRTFQKRSGLPANGLLDEATQAALQTACGGPRRRRQAQMPPPPQPAPAAAAPEDDAAATEPAASADAAPDGGDVDSGDGAAAVEAPDSGDSEVSASEREGETQQELLVSDACQVRIRRHDPVPVSDIARLKQTAQAPGVYIIYVEGTPWYVGVAERTIYLRLKERMKTLRDFKIPSSSLSNRTVAWVSIQSGAFKSCSIGRRDGGNAAGGYRPLKGVYAVLKVLEQHFIKTTGTTGRGNERRENVVFGPAGSLTIQEEGKPDLTLSGASLSYRRPR